MFQNKHKLKCEGKQNDVNNDQEEPTKDIELCLEVEMDDEVRDIITSPERCASTLLDVTVIKPKEVDHIYTTHKKTLNGEEVRRLITSIELEKDEQKKFIKKILSKDNAVGTTHKHNISKVCGNNKKSRNLQPTEKNRKPLNNTVHCMNSEESALFFEHLQKLSTTDETTSEAPSGYNQQHRSVSKADNDRVEQIYTTPRTYNDLKALFTCKNKNKYDQNEKPNKPCLCQNCAILGLLSDAQKRPFVTENSYDPREHTLPHKRLTSDKPKRKKSVNFKDESHTECEYYFRYLSSKIKTLEERLAIQEERSVTKEYFKKIITKLVNHISKLTGSGQPTHEGNHQKYKDYKEPRRSREKSFESSGHRYYVHPVLIDQKLNSNVPVEKDASPIKQNAATTSHMSSGIPTQGAHDSFWKWGEEILKPGIDLKNKIIDLLEETLQNLRRPKENVSKADGNIKNIVDDFSNRLYKTINEIPVRDVPSVPERSKRKEQNKTHSDPNHSNSGSSISKQLDYLTKTSCNKKNAKLPSKLLPKQDAQREEPLNVSYVSPKIKGWHDESQFSFKFESSDIDSTKNMDDKKLNECYKQEFMQTICNTKEADKLKLWQNIWNQAKVNGQSRHDKVTIQIPNRKDLKKNKMIEIEYTIEELESLLIGKAPANKANFSHKKK